MFEGFLNIKSLTRVHLCVPFKKRNGGTIVVVWENVNLSV